VLNAVDAVAGKAVAGRAGEAPPIDTMPTACAVKVPCVVLLIVRVQVATLPTTVGAPHVVL